MSNYEVALLWAAGLLILSLIVSFTALTNRRPIGVGLVIFILGGFAFYYASTFNHDGNLVQDIPGALYKLYAKVMN
ncbi:MAG TPA: hypothetical protein EYG79_02915 [Rhodobacteraceae bacterium]|nr:hypothetical protein [Paracoccaceae bacterium]